MKEERDRLARNSMSQNMVAPKEAGIRWVTFIRTMDNGRHDEEGLAVRWRSLPACLLKRNETEGTAPAESPASTCC